MNGVLAGLLAVLMVLVGRKRGVRALAILAVNIFGTVVFVFFMSSGFSPVVVIGLCCAAVAACTLFGINGYNKKTLSAYWSVLAVAALMLGVILLVEDVTAIHGFSAEDAEEISYYSEEIAFSMPMVASAVMLMGFIGAAADIAMSVVSGMQEIYESNPDEKQSELLKKTFLLGSDIIGTTVNTLFFAYLGSFTALMIWFLKYRYSFAEVLNSKLFAAEIIQMLVSGIGCVLILPVAVAIHRRKLIHIKRE